MSGQTPAPKVSISTGAGIALALALALVLVAILGAYVALIWTGRPTAELGALLDRLWTYAGAGGGVLGAILAGAAARHASQASRQTNGVLDLRMRNAVAEGVAEVLARSGTVPGSRPEAPEPSDTDIPPSIPL